jgi:probable HAF family extracellular repeat protein
MYHQFARKTATIHAKRFASAALAVAALVASLVLATSAAGTAEAEAAETACSPAASILARPRVGAQEVQAKALNDRGDIVGFADSSDPKAKAIHAILWKDGKTALDLGVLPGYVSSEAYGVNNNRVVFGLLYDKKERTFPFRWEAGRMTLLKGPGGRLLPADVPDRNTINDRGQMAGTMLIAGQRKAVRWSPDGRATLLPALPGHTWTNAWGINGDGVVSGWSRKLPNEDGENNPVIWDASGKVIALKTATGRADGAAEATNRSGLTVGYLGNLGTDDVPGVANTDPERGNAVVWQSRMAAPRFLGPPAPVHVIAELVDVNDSGQAAGMSVKLMDNGFTLSRPGIWRAGWAALRPIAIPAALRKNPVVITQLNDINNRGDVVGNVYGLAAKDYGALRRIDPVLWTCQFDR